MPAAAQASCRRAVGSFEIGRGMWRRALSALQELGDGCLLNLSAIRVIDRDQIGQRELLLLKPCAHIFGRLGNGRLVVPSKHAAHGCHNAVWRRPRQKILDHLCHAQTMPRLTGPFHGRQDGANSKRPHYRRRQDDSAPLRAGSCAGSRVAFRFRCMRPGKQRMELARTPLRTGLPRLTHVGFATLFPPPARRNRVAGRGRGEGWRGKARGRRERRGAWARGSHRQPRLIVDRSVSGKHPPPRSGFARVGPPPPLASRAGGGRK